ncbi:MAG: (2Fe-2S)-binding protein [Planctomycetes bacterium]|nr:(2Fe-2S)-binding protein [Planctomycetota bacterium]MBL7007465.1 (2Fe-2S)-binding protein [Planctomycetota bacterium]
MIQSRHQLSLNGAAVSFAAGETVLAVAARAGTAIPTLCHDSRLEPAGCCRSCLVEIEGRPRMAPACATPAADGMVVATASERVARHRRTLLSMYLADQPAGPERGGHSCELHAMADEFGAAPDWPKMAPLRAGRADPNPYILFEPDKCILCARCTRYCDEVEGVSAIALAKRGPATTISTADGRGLLDTSCELCGGCIDVCPTGAMTEKMPRTAAAPPERELEPVRTTCNYCGVGCQMDLNVDRAANRVVKVTSPPPGTTTNDGNLCVKGRFAYDFIGHPDRLTTPLVRAQDGSLREASWDEALQRAADGLRGVAERHGRDALGFVSSSRCTGEENYLVQKLARAVFDTNNVHQCSAT